MIQTPPKVITSKDLFYLKDQMSWLLLAMKKAYHYEQSVTCQQMKQSFNKIGQMHQRHYQTLLQHCQTNNTAGINQFNQQMQMAQQNRQQQSQGMYSINPT